MAKIINFISSPLQKKKLIVQCLSVLFVIRIALWCLPFRWINSWLATPSNAGGTIKTDWTVVRELAHAIRACAKFVPSATCLTQAIAARFIFERHGQPCRISIGVKKGDEKGFKAHAWIEVEGRIVLGDHPERNQFVVLNASRATSQ